MKFNRLVFALPCYGLDDFPESLAEPLAANFHSCWTSLWHPDLLAMAGTIPEWKRADSSSLDLEHGVVLVPEVSVEKVDQTLRERLSLNRSLCVDGVGGRSSVLKLLATSISTDPEVAPSEMISRDFLARENEARPFFAIGFAYLQIQLLTRKLRYSSNLNEPLFTEQILAAAKAWSQADLVESERWLQSCYDQLSQERDHYYSQTAYLLDMTLLAKTTMGPKFQRQLDASRPLNLLASAGLLKEMAEGQPESFRKLQEGIESGKVELVGGLKNEVDFFQMTSQGMRRCLEDGFQAYAELELPHPKVFSRYSRGMHAEMPMFLQHYGYQGAVLIDWENGENPLGNQGKITWEAADGTGLDTIANHVLDASSSSSFLAIGSTLGSQLDHHQVPMLMLAHWPEGTCEAFLDFQMVVEKTPALGVWTGIASFFENTQRPYHQDRISPSKFFGGLETQSGCLEWWSSRAKLESAGMLHTLTNQIQHYVTGGKGPKLECASTIRTRGGEGGAELEGYLALLPSDLKLDSSIEIDSNQVDRERHKDLDRLIRMLPRARDGGGSTGMILVNPYGGPRRTYLAQSAGTMLKQDERLYAVDGDSQGVDAVVDIPPSGLVRLEYEKNPQKSKRKVAPISSAQGVLSNEFIEAHIDPKSGRLQSLYIAQRRGNRMSGMLSLRRGVQGSSKGVEHAVMIADKIITERSNSSLGRIRIEGKLAFEGQTAAQFTLRYSLIRGSRLLEVEAEVTRKSPSDSPIEICWRTAWPNEAATLSIWNHGVKQHVSGRRMVSPYLVEIDEVEHRGYLLTGGASQHLKSGDRFLDTLLAPKGAPATSNRIALAIDLPRPFQAAVEWLDPPILAEDPLGPLASGNAAWFIQSNVPNVSLQPWNSIVDAQGMIIGMRAILQEMVGKSAATRIELFRTPKRADRVQHSGKSLGGIEIDGDSLVLSVHANEQSFLDILWSS